MCSSQTIRSPGCGVTPEPFGIALPVFCAQAYTSSTRPKPWPFSPSGTPAWRAAHEVKYAHHGPTPEPAVAWRNWAMRGESLEPGGCSLTPTSPRTAFTMAWPAEFAGPGTFMSGAAPPALSPGGPADPAGAPAPSPAAPAAPGAAPAFRSCMAKELVAVAGAVADGGVGGTAGGANVDWS